MFLIFKLLIYVNRTYKMEDSKIDIDKKEKTNWKNNWIKSVLEELEELLEIQSVSCLCMCMKVGYGDSIHLSYIDIVHSKMCSALKDATHDLIEYNTSINKYKVLSTWNRRVKHLHSVAKNIVYIYTGYQEEKKEEPFNTTKWLLPGKCLRKHLANANKMNRVK